MGSLKQINSWSFDLNCKENFVVFYGNDLALSLSLSRFADSDWLTNPSIPELYSESLFEPKPKRIMCSNTFLNSVVKTYSHKQFPQQVIGVIDGKITAKDSNILYVQCDNLTSRSRQWFLSKYAPHFGLKDITKLSWVNNLDDLKFASILNRLGYSDFMRIENNESDVWSQIRRNQFKGGTLGQIWKHFELWARDNVPSTETLEILVHELSNV